MRRYVTRPQARWCEALGEEVADPPFLTVFEPDFEPQFTGLFDSQGNELFAVETREPIGFKTGG